MSFVPPHLPAPSCDIETHRRIERIKLILISVFFGVLAGGSSAIMVLGWVWPGLGGGDSWISSRTVTAQSRETLDDQTRVELENRVGTIYKDTNDQFGVSYFAAEKVLGQAFVVSSDGWMVFYSTNTNLDLKGAKILMKDGEVFAVQKTVRDNNSNLVYLKISASDAGAQFKVVNFIGNLKPNSDVYVNNQGMWKHAGIYGKVAHAKNIPHLDTAPSLAYELDSAFSAGDIVANAEGKIAGVLVSPNLMLPSDYLNGTLPGVLSSEKVVYRSLGVYGWFSDEQPLIVNGEKVGGFLVTKTVSGSQFKTGDVILTVNGVLADGDNMWYNIMNNSSVKLQILRKGKTVDLTEEIKQL